MRVFIGTSGWQYWHWRGIFYPYDLKSKDWLNFYNQHFNTVEINVTFYRDVKPSTLKNWYTTVRDDFIFSLKLTRQITHFKKLKVDKEMIDNFTKKISILNEKLGIILIQLPPSFKFDEAVLGNFFSMLDKNFNYAIEVRNITFIDDKFFNMLRENKIAFCIADSAGRYPYYEAITTDFIYIRLHGSQKLYASDYSDRELIDWADKIKRWNKRTYVYFDNDFMGYAVKNALRLKELLTF